MQDVTSFSEPVGSLTAGPEPNFLTAGFDDEAISGSWEVERLTYLDHLATEQDGDRA